MNPYQISNDDQNKYVHLKVTELIRSMEFYVELLGFKVILAYEDHTAAYLSAGSHHYLLALDTWFAQHLPQSEAQGTGIFHSLIQYPTRKDLAVIYLNLKTAAYPLVDAVNLGVSEIIYLEDPDGNSMELCWDRPKKEWPKKPNGSFELSSRPLDLEGLLLML
jgi:catechol 2,3-dioxygenase